MPRPNRYYKNRTDIYKENNKKSSQKKAFLKKMGRSSKTIQEKRRNKSNV